MKLKYFPGLMMMATSLLASSLIITSCSDDDNYSVSTTPIVTSITTGDAAVTAVSAAIDGTVDDLSSADPSSYEVGVMYSTADDPTAGGTKVRGSLSADTIRASLSGLHTGTTYHYATYVCLQNKVYKYGEVKTFVATDAKAETLDATDISYTKATFSASFSGLEGLGTVEKGMKIGMSKDLLSDGRDFDLTTVGGLLPGTTYYYKAFVKVGDGYVYGPVKQLTTKTQTMEYVDLGLSITWAKCNIGAESEEGVGAYFGYGDKTAEQYSKDNADYSAGDIANTELDLTNNLDIDGSFPFYSQMPTLDQVKELIEKTKKTFDTVNGVKGIRFTAGNGNSIFLPYTGYRDGKEIINDGKAFYWTGTASKVDGNYANTLTFDGNGIVKNGNSLRHYGVCLRTVRPYSELKPNGSGKLDIGDLEKNGRIRIEIYSEYGTTKGNAVIDPTSIRFSNTMAVTFKISGLDGNYKSGAAKENIAGLEYADASWDPSHWSGLTGDKYDARITGDGTYTVWMETGGATADGAIVFCIDINNLDNDLVDASKVKAEIVNIALDTDPTVGMDFSKTEFVNKDGNDTDGRIEIYSEYGSTKQNGVDASGLHFAGNMIVNFTIKGIDGNLKAGAAKSYKTELSYADPDWSPSYWGGSSFGRTTVTGDGSYSVFATLPGECQGAVVWTVELYNLWKDLVDPTKVKVTINSVETPGKLH